MSHPVNLYHDADGRTHLRYWAGGAPRERVTAFPAALLTAPPDPEADVAVCPLRTPAEALSHLFRAIPLRPDLPWALDGDFSPLWRTAFADALRMLRLPPEARWCRRGEPGWFVQFGFCDVAEDAPFYNMDALVLPTGKPAVLTFRPEDLLDALPPPMPWIELEVTSQADGLPAQTDRLPWCGRVRLPIVTPGAAHLTLKNAR